MFSETSRITHSDGHVCRVTCTRTRPSQLGWLPLSGLAPPSCLGDSPRPLSATLLMPVYLSSFMRISNKSQVRLPFHPFTHSVDTPYRSLSAAEFWREHCGCAQLFCGNCRSDCNTGNTSIRCHKGFSTFRLTTVLEH